jgi:hypothetical protein
MGPTIARLFILLWHVWRWSIAILVETFLSARLLIPEACIPVASAVPHGVPLSYISMVSFSTRVRADHEGITTPSPHEVDAEDRYTDEESEEDEVVDRHIAAIAGVSGVIVAI